MAAITVKARQTTFGAGVFISDNQVQPVDALLPTDGRGLWSSTRTQVRITGLALNYVSDDAGFGELRVFFDLATWDTFTEGLIYTDKSWLQSLREFLAVMGLVGGVGYSEQGMQGDNFVSLDVEGDFIASWRRIFG